MPPKRSDGSSSKGVKVRAASALRVKDTGGREVWHVTSDGQSKTVVTSSSSAAAMDQAIVIYSDALKRLAKR